mgnify:CR=1 FL=1|tara:strand:+ start:439 stop:1110 length:672 start_codon:yes stop_codon:yes gene_type:complete
MRFESLSNFVNKEIIESFDVVWDHLGRSGAWWTGAQRIAIAEQVRCSAPRPLWDKAPPLDSFSDDHDGELTYFEKGVVERVTVEPSSIDLETYREIISRIGEDKYAELAAVVSQIVPIDHLHDALGIDRQQLPPVTDAPITQERPDALVYDVGFLPTLPSEGLPHVAVALSLALADNARRMLLVRSMYSGKSFEDMVWTHRNLSRPQIELVAARTSALNECFY